MKKKGNNPMTLVNLTRDQGRATKVISDLEEQTEGKKHERGRTYNLIMQQIIKDILTDYKYFMVQT